MKITNEWLKEKRACQEGYKWAQGQKNREVEAFVFALLNDDHFNWANWVIVRCIDKYQKIKYAVFCAETVIHIYEKKYPNDNRPRRAIEAAKESLKNHGEEIKAKVVADAAADAAAYAYAANASYAAYAAYAAKAAADAAYAYAANASYAAYAAYAAKAAADAAYAYAAYAAKAAADAAVYTAKAAAYAAYASNEANAYAELKAEIIKFGVSLILSESDKKARE